MRRRADRMFDGFDEIFRSCGWRPSSCATARGWRPRSREIRRSRSWLDALPNADHSALLYLGGAAWRARIEADLGKKAGAFPQSPRRRGAARADERPRRPLHGNAGRGVRRGAGRCSDPVRRLDGQGLRPALRRPQGQSCRPDEPDPGAALREAMGVARGRGVGAAGRRRRQRSRASRRSSSSADRPGEARAVVRTCRSRRSPAPQARSSRPRPPSAGSCSTSPVGASAGRPDRHHLARRHRLDQPRRLREPARPVQTARNGGRFRASKDLPRRKNGRPAIKASISSSASPRSTCS